MRLQTRGTGRVQVRGLIDDDPGVLPGNQPGLQSRQGQRQPGRQRRRLCQQRPGAAFTHRQHTRDLSDRGQLMDGAFPRGRDRRRQRLRSARIPGSEPDLQRREHRLQTRQFRQSVQTPARRLTQRISIEHQTRLTTGTRITTGTVTDRRTRAPQGIRATQRTAVRRNRTRRRHTQRSSKPHNRRGKRRHRLPGLRTQSHTASHTHRLLSGTDNQGAPAAAATATSPPATGSTWG